jgi:hypothetical protein
MKRIFTKQIDERQEKELLQIGNIGFYLVYFALLVSICVQSVGRVPLAQIAAELIIFFASSIFVVVACIVKGQWDFCTGPTWKTYIIASALTALVGSGILAFAYDWSDPAKTWSHIMYLGIIAFCTFAICFALLVLAGELVKRRRKRLEERFDQQK